jgi:hypothetical protein
MQIVNIVGTYICHWALKGSIVLQYVEYIAWALNVKVTDLAYNSLVQSRVVTGEKCGGYKVDGSA